MGKLKILCIHGYRQNETMFREKSGAFRKLIKKHADFFLSSPHEIPEEGNLAKPSCDRERGWWFSKPERRYNALDRTDCCIGFEESLKMIEEAFEVEGPFDGVLGFSQGASFVSLLCTCRNNPKYKIEFKFAIIVAGFKSLLSLHADYYKDPIACPSFHTIGLSDAVIPTESSEDLLSSFVKGTAFRHGGGHFMPASPQLRTALVEFLSAFIIS